MASSKDINLYPDILTLGNLIWLRAIPYTLIIIPIWYLLDVRLVASIDLKRFKLESVNLATNRFFRIIRELKKGKDLDDISKKLFKFITISYYSWSNRGKSQMTVWILRA